MARPEQEDTRLWLSWLRRFSEEHDGVVIQEPLVVYEPSLFAEAVHLNARGAERYTDLLADQLQSLKKLPRGRS